MDKAGKVTVGRIDPGAAGHRGPFTAVPAVDRNTPVTHWKELNMFFKKLKNQCAKITMQRKKYLIFKNNID